jgi:hypothetical protein
MLREPARADRASGEGSKCFGIVAVLDSGNDAEEASTLYRVLVVWVMEL